MIHLSGLIHNNQGTEFDVFHCQISLQQAFLHKD